MKNKLKKKGKLSTNIIFPAGINRDLDKQDNYQEKIDKKIETVHKNRSLSKKKEKSNAFLRDKSYQKSLSSFQKGYWISKPTNISNQTSKHLNRPEISNTIALKARCKSAIKLRTPQNSLASMQISKIFYNQIEKKLIQKCEGMIQQHKQTFLKQENYSFKNVAKNTYLLQDTTKKREPTDKYSNLLEKRSLEKAKTLKTAKSVHSIALSLVDNQSSLDCIPILHDHNLINILETGSELHINIGSSSQSQSNFRDLIRANSSVIERINQSQISSSKNSQNLNASTLSLIKDKKVWFYPQKSESIAKIKTPTFLCINQIKVKKNEFSGYQMSMFVEFHSQVLFKKIIYNPSYQKRMYDPRHRKGNHKRFVLVKQKAKQKIFNHLQNGNIQNIILFYQDLISFLSNYNPLSKTYRGISFLDLQDGKQYEQRIFQYLKVNKSFYFLAKINETFYFFKASCTNHQEINFIVLYDFTTHNKGEHLSFRHIPSTKIRKEHYQFLSHRMFIRSIEEFTEKIQQQFQCQRDILKQRPQRQNFQEFSKITSQIIELLLHKALKEVEKPPEGYTLIDNISNFFQFHNQFDYGILNQKPIIAKSLNYEYSFNQPQNLQVYRYPNSYHWLKLSQMQQQAVLISNIPFILSKELTRQSTQILLETIIKNNQNESRPSLIFHYKKNRINLMVKKENLEICLQSLSNYKSYKIFMPLVNFQFEYLPIQNFRIQNLDHTQKTKLLSRVERNLKQYTLQKGFIYSKYKLSTKEGNCEEILHKHLVKLESYFAFITLYKVCFNDIIEYKIYVPRLDKQFILKIDNSEEFNYWNIKELSKNFLHIIKNIYFKKLLIQEMNKYKKRRIDAFQQTFRKYGKAYITSVRSKKKHEQQMKRRMNKMASLKNCNMGKIMAENIVSKFYISRQKIRYFITIRYTNNNQYEQRSNILGEQVQICLYRQQSLSHYKCNQTVKQMIKSFTKGKFVPQQIVQRQKNIFFNTLYSRIMQIIDCSSDSLNIIILKLKRLLIYPSQSIKYIPLISNPYKLINNSIYKIETSSNCQIAQSRPLSINLGLMRNSSIIFDDFNKSQLSYFNSSVEIQNLSKIQVDCSKPINYIFYRILSLDYTIEIYNIYEQNSDKKILKNQKSFQKQVYITDQLDLTKKLITCWQVNFINQIPFKHYNKRMFKRMAKSIKQAL